MDRRWITLAVLFAARATMAFQFQTVAAVSPLLQRDLGVSLADLGILIGIYLAPGIVLAVPGGAIGSRFGERNSVVAAFLIALAGGVLTVALTTWGAQIAGRLLIGTGGVLLTVVMTKMVADWFEGREMATAMAAYVNSWPAGIALALVTLSPIGEAYGIQIAFAVSTFVTAAGLVLFATVYRDPPPAPQTRSAAPALSAFDGRTLWALIAASLIWTFFNIGFAMVFSFGPTMLVERGYTVTAASAVVSVTLWLSILSVPLGGYLADRSGRSDLILVIGSFFACLTLFLAARLEAAVVGFAVLGILSGLPAGAIMNLPARLLSPSARALGMGIFYAVFYLGFVIGTAAGGFIARGAGTAAATFDYAVILIALAPLLLAFFRFKESAPASFAASSTSHFGKLSETASKAPISGSPHTPALQKSDFSTR